MAVTGSGIPEAEKVPDSSSIIWQEELQSREADVGQVWSSPDMAPLGSPTAGKDSAGRCVLEGVGLCQTGMCMQDRLACLYYFGRSATAVSCRRFPITKLWKVDNLFKKSPNICQCSRLMYG